MIIIVIIIVIIIIIIIIIIVNNNDYDNNNIIIINDNDYVDDDDDDSGFLKVYAHVRDQLWRDSSTTSHNWLSNFVNSIYISLTKGGTELYVVLPAFTV